MKTIYLDNAATSFPKPPGVAEAMSNFLSTGAGNPGRGGHALAREAGRVVESARRALAGLIHAPDPSRIVFTLNATDALHIAFDGVLRPGDHVVTSPFEHNSVMRPLRQWRERGVEVDIAPARGGALDVDGMIELIRPGKTRLVAFTYASNVSGRLAPAQEIIRAARERGGAVLLDAAQTAGHIDLDVLKLGAQLVAFSGHKGLLGPTGTGVLYVEDGFEVEPVRAGGTGTNSESDAQPREFPQRLESGTPNTVGLAGLLAALEFIEQTGMEKIINKQDELMSRLIGGLRKIDGVRIVGDMSLPGVPVVSVVFERADVHEVAALLDARHSIAVRAGLHCAPEAHRVFGTSKSGALRISPGFFNSEADIDAVLSAIEQTLLIFV